MTKEEIIEALDDAIRLAEELNQLIEENEKFMKQSNIREFPQQ